MNDRASLLLVSVWLTFVALVYVPDVGRGFIKDDFVWIADGRSALANPTELIFPQRPGFYRPIVTLSFGLDDSVLQLAPKGYGLTNLLLYLAVAMVLFALSRELGLSTAASMFAVFVWGANPHGINMALLWLSGRTALWLTLFSLLAAVALLRGHRLWAAACVLAALGSKEEAVLLPFVLFICYLIAFSRGPVTGRTTLATLGYLVIPLAIYAICRAQSAAYTPLSAPAFYRFTFEPGLVMRNALEYLDRAATFACLATAAIVFIVYRVTPVVTSKERQILAASAIWLIAGFGLTVFLPVRSSLYAVCPSIGAAIASATVFDNCRRRADMHHRTVPALAVLIIFLILIPVYRSRNGRWVLPAITSRETLRLIAEDLKNLPRHGFILLEDRDQTRANFASAFGTLATEAVCLSTATELETWIEPPSQELGDVKRPSDAPVVATYRFSAGHVVRLGES